MVKLSRPLNKLSITIRMREFNNKRVAKFITIAVNIKHPGLKDYQGVGTGNTHEVNRDGFRALRTGKNFSYYNTRHDYNTIVRLFQSTNSDFMSF